MRVQSVQPTPNPNAFKFVLDGTILAAGTRNYARAEEAAGDRLAAAIFAIPGVETVFYCEDFVTVSMGPSADWRAVHDAVVKVLEGREAGTAPAAGTAARTEPGAAAPTAVTPAADGNPELLRQINELLDDRVRPALAGDGGGLEVLALEGKTLRIRYQGACGSCPSSIEGTLNAIQNLIQTEIDEQVEVVSA